LWGAIGLFALGVVLVTAIQIATAPKPIAVPNATKPQLASAESLSVLLRADSTAVGPNVGLGNLLYDTGNFNQAIPFYRRALGVDPSLIDVQVDLAVSYHNDGQSELAREVLEDAVTRRPDHAVAHFDLGVVYTQLGRREDARRVLVKARTLEGPPEMMKVVDQLIVHLDGPEGASPLPPGHPPTGAPAAP
jgi:Flp pilus assembly protein TadD